MAEALLNDEIVEFFATGINVSVATRDAALEPEAMYAMGIRVHADRNTVTVYLPEQLAAGTLRNLRENGQIAITIERPRDHRGMQFKGEVSGIRASDAHDRDAQLMFRGALAEQFESVGIPRSLTRRMAWWPSVAVDVRVRDVFEQTPGPRAGVPLGSAGGER